MTTSRESENNSSTYESTYPIAVPELDHPIGGIDTEGPASPGGADGVAGREALSHLQGVMPTLIDGNARNGRPAGKLLHGTHRRRSGGDEQQRKS